MSRLFITLLAVLLVSTACIGGSNEIALTIDLRCTNGVSCEWGDRSQGCHGTGGYSDIRDGMKVTVRDGDGTVLSTGTMEDSTGTCVFRGDFEVGNADFYEIVAGNRSPYVVSKSELESNEWKLRLEIGSDY